MSSTFVAMSFRLLRNINTITMSSTDTPPPAAVPAHVQAMDDDDPKEYKPSPKVAVVVAGAAVRSNVSCLPCRF
jgi:hypothetical protein